MAQSSVKAKGDWKEFENRYIKVSSVIFVLSLLWLMNEYAPSFPYSMRKPMSFFLENKPMNIIGMLAVFFSPALAFSGLSYSRGFYKKEKRLPRAIFFLSLGLMIPSIYFVMELLSIR